MITNNIPFQDEIIPTCLDHLNIWIPGVIGTILRDPRGSLINHVR